MLNVINICRSLPLLFNVAQFEMRELFQSAVIHVDVMSEFVFIETIHCNSFVILILIMIMIVVLITT